MLGDHKMEDRHAQGAALLRPQEDLWKAAKGQTGAVEATARRAELDGAETDHGKAIVRDVAPRTRLEQRQQRIIEIAQAVNEGQDLQTVLRMVRDAVVEVGGFDRAGIFLYEEEADRLRGTWGTDATGERTDESDLTFVPALHADPRIRLCLEGKLLYYLRPLDPSLDSAYRSFAPSEECCHVTVALRARDRVIGLLFADSLLTKRALTDKDVEALLPFCEQAALAIEGARQRAAEYEKVERLAQLLARAQATRRKAEREAAERKRAQETQARLASELEQQHQWMKEILATLPGVVWEVWGEPGSPDQKIGFISDHVETMLGYRTEEWLSTPGLWWNAIHPEDWNRVMQEARARFAVGREGISQFRMIAKDGRVVWVESRSVIVRDQNGRPIGMRGLMMDITERKRAEEALMQQAQQLACSRADQDSDSSLLHVASRRDF